VTEIYAFASLGWSKARSSTKGGSMGDDWGDRPP